MIKSIDGPVTLKWYIDRSGYDKYTYFLCNDTLYGWRAGDSKPRDDLHVNIIYIGKPTGRIEKHMELKSLEGLDSIQLRVINFLNKRPWVVIDPFWNKTIPGGR